MRVLLSCLIIISLSLVSCSTEQTEDVVIDQKDQKVVGLRFVINQSVDKDATIRLDDESEIFITEGYSIHITGNIHQKHANHSNVDLKEDLSILITGDVEVSISHPDFMADSLSTKAYLGVVESVAYEEDVDMSNIEMSLVQGGVFIMAPETLDSVITDVKILGKSSKLGMMYYTAAEMVDVNINTIEGNFVSEHANMLGGEKHYLLNSIEDGLTSPHSEMNTLDDWN
jgi:hypothetical protein